MKKKKKKTPNEKKLSFSRVISNNIYALALIWKASPIYISVYIGSSFIYGLLGFFSEGYLLRRIVNGIEAGEDIKSVFAYVFAIAVTCIVAYTALQFFWNVISPVQTRKILARVEKLIFKKTSEVELACYEDPEFYEKYVRAMDEAYGRTMEVMYTLDDLVSRAIALFANSILLFVIDPVLVAFALIPFVMGFFRRFENKAHYEFEKGRKKIDRQNEYVKRTFYLNEYAKEMRIGGMYRYMLERFRAMLSEYKKNAVKHGKMKMIYGFINQFGLHVITILGATLYSVYSALVVTSENGGMTVGDCIVVLGSIGIISTCLSELIQNIARFGEHALFLEDVRYFLEYEPLIRDGDISTDGIHEDIEVKNVSFRYKGADKDALRNVSFSLHKGERIAVVGANGSGKTTLVKLLLRLYDPTDGEILYGSENIKKFNLRSYRDLFGTVFQDVRVFSLSVKENVLLRECNDGDDEVVINALKESGVWERVSRMEKGIDTILTKEFDKGGEVLSGGELQKLSLARVFATKTPIVILDEPSSALDPIAEYQMFENMMRAVQNRSVIFISHRLSSARLADKVILMDSGEIIETGTHKELMEMDGKYAEMFRKQAENYVGSEVALDVQ